MSALPNISAVTTTVGSRDDAESLAALLVEEKLAACVQFWPISSVYRWKGQVESASEHLLVAKTRTSAVARLVSRIRENHSYELPEVLVTPIEDGSPDYLKWVSDEVGDS